MESQNQILKKLESQRETYNLRIFPIGKFTKLIMQAHVKVEIHKAQNPMLSNIRNREQKQITEKKMEDFETHNRIFSA